MSTWFALGFTQEIGGAPFKVYLDRSRRHSLGVCVWSLVLSLWCCSPLLVPCFSAMMFLPWTRWPYTESIEPWAKSVLSSLWDIVVRYCVPVVGKLTNKLFIEEIFLSQGYIFGAFVENQLTVDACVYFCVLYLVPLVYESVLCQLPCYFVTMNLYYVLKSGIMML